MKRAFNLITVIILVAIVCATGRAQQPSGLASVSATSIQDLRTWDAFVNSGSRAGDLRMASVVTDPSMPQRSVERYQQFYEGVPVWGANVVRDSDNGATASVFGAVLPTGSIETTPAISVEQARDTFVRLAGPGGVLVRDAELTIAVLGEGEGAPHLTYMAVIGGASFPTRVFLDAQSGDELFRLSEIRPQAPLPAQVAVGTGRGLLGDLRKISAKKEGSTYFLDDQLRPPVLDTFDMKGGLTRTISVVDGGGPLFSTDRASDSDNVWTDIPVIDAHVNVGLTYDYYFQRFGRRGLDDRNRPILNITNAVSQLGARALPSNLLGTWAINAFWCDLCGPSGIGVIFFGNGAPLDVTFGGHAYTYFAGALDVVGHELTHGVTSSTSNLVYLNESGALNESFSDMMGTSIEFYYQSPGNGPGRADYVLGEDISKAVAGGPPDGDRSMENPGLYGDPDHYSRRFVGTADNGGVHHNSGISNNAFYLAIEGGANRTSGLTVQGVGAANREQIEKVFYRAFTFLLPSSATFATARSATIQAARDLYGSGSAAERAVTQAWTAVGVN